MRYRVEAEGGSMRLESTPARHLIEAILPVTDIDSRTRRARSPEAMPA
jgi:hypothetical protein